MVVLCMSNGWSSFSDMKVEEIELECQVEYVVLL